MAIDYTALADELTAGHPDTGAYNADSAIAASEINAVNRTRIRASMSGSEIWAATDSAELAALTAGARGNWLAFCAIDSHNPEAGGLAQLFTVSIFGGDSATVSTLASTRQEVVSRSVELGLGSVKAGEIEVARN